MAWPGELSAQLMIVEAISMFTLDRKMCFFSFCVRYSCNFVTHDEINPTRLDLKSNGFSFVRSFVPLWLRRNSLEVSVYVCMFC